MVPLTLSRRARRRDDFPPSPERQRGRSGRARRRERFSSLAPAQRGRGRGEGARRYGLRFFAGFAAAFFVASATVFTGAFAAGAAFATPSMGAGASWGVSTISIRRFRARPVALRFDEIGSHGPYAAATSRRPGTFAFSSRKRTTFEARAAASSQFVG